tara:strand:- start:77 stop:397 length:321 start_codon:yes stop_codon:yes gene_type:complete
MVSALEAVMGGDTAQSLMTDAFSDLGMTQTKLHLSKPNVFHQGHCLKTNLVIFLFFKPFIRTIGLSNVPAKHPGMRPDAPFDLLSLGCSGVVGVNAWHRLGSGPSA